MKARVFVHPRCWDGPAMAALSSYLEVDRRWNMDKLSIGPLATHHRRELVRTIHEEGALTTFERMDGSQFVHRMGQPVPDYTPAPEAA